MLVYQRVHWCVFQARSTCKFSANIIHVEHNAVGSFGIDLEELQPWETAWALLHGVEISQWHPARLAGWALFLWWDGCLLGTPEGNRGMELAQWGHFSGGSWTRIVSSLKNWGHWGPWGCQEILDMGCSGTRNQQFELQNSHHLLMVDTLNIPQLLKLLKGLKSYPKGTPGHGVYIESLLMIINPQNLMIPDPKIYPSITNLLKQ